MYQGIYWLPEYFNPLGMGTPGDDLLILQNLVRGLFPNTVRIVEVGSWVGLTALAMAEAAPALVHCVDTWNGSKNDVTGELSRINGGWENVFRVFCSNV